MELEYKAYWALKMLNLDAKAVREKRKIQIHKLEEMRLNAYSSLKLYKERTQKYHDKKILERIFGQSMLLFNFRLRLFLGKLKSKWLRPYIVKEVKPYGAMELEDSISHRSWIVNGQRVKPYLDNKKEELTIVIL